MRLIKPSFEIIEQQHGLEGIYKIIEQAGRTCYKSCDKITEDSAKEFVNRIIGNKHHAVLEHGTVYLDFVDNIAEARGRYTNNHYSRMYKNTLEDDRGHYHLYVTTNFRVLVENKWLDDLQYICEPTRYHEKRYTVRFICDRGVSHEFVRHRVFSFAQESTRYCNYSKDKFGNEVTFIIPCWTNLPEQEYGDRVNPKVFNRGNTNGIETSYVDSLRQAEYNYFNLLNQGWKPQQARAVLPNALKTELVMTGFITDWEHFFKLRSKEYGGGNPHPQADELATPLYYYFKGKKWLGQRN